MVPEIITAGMVMMMMFRMMTTTVTQLFHGALQSVSDLKRKDGKIRSGLSACEWCSSVVGPFRGTSREHSEVKGPLKRNHAKNRHK